MPWSDRVVLHISADGTRADFDKVFEHAPKGSHVYTCGPDVYMSAVIEAATRNGVPEQARHLEYFSAPEQPDLVNQPFKLKLARSGRILEVPADRSATDVLAEAGVPVDVKCSDGLCGVCKCRVLSGAVEHRDFVLSAAQREHEIILCQSRAQGKDGVIEIDL